MAGIWQSISLLLLCMVAVYETGVATVQASKNSKVPPAMIYPWYGKYSGVMKWGRPYDLSVPVDYFKVSINCTKDGVLEHEATTTEEKITLTNIPKDQCCYAGVTAINAAGPGPISKLVAINPRSQPKYYKITQYRTTYGKNNVTFRWTTKPYPIPGTIYKFNVRISASHHSPYSNRPSRSHSVSKNIWCKGPKCTYPCGAKISASDGEFNQTQSYFNVTLPTIPASQYFVQIKSMTVDGQVGKMRGVYSFTTRPAAPSSPVRDLKVLSKNETSITASWDIPLESNGRVYAYNVTLAYNKQNCSSLNSSDDYYVFSITNRTVDYSPNNTYVLMGLQPYTQYSLSVNAINSAGPGLNWSQPVQVRTDPLKVIRGHLRNITTVVDTRSVQIAWRPACPIEGPVSSYSIDVFNRGQLVKSLNTTNTSVTVPDLQPDSFYTTLLRGNNTQISSSVDTLTKVEINVCRNKWTTLRDYFLGKFNRSRVTIAGQAAILRRKLNETAEETSPSSSPTQDENERELALLSEMDKDYVDVLLEQETPDEDIEGFFEKLDPSVRKMDSSKQIEFRWEVKILLLKYLECQNATETKPWI